MRVCFLAFFALRPSSLVNRPLSVGPIYKGKRAKISPKIHKIEIWPKYEDGQVADEEGGEGRHQVRVGLRTISNHAGDRRDWCIFLLNLAFCPKVSSVVCFKSLFLSVKIKQVEIYTSWTKIEVKLALTRKNRLSSS